MWRSGIVILMACTYSFALRAQLHNSFTVSDNSNFDNVQFSLNASQGKCFIEGGHNSNLIDIRSNTEETKAPKFNEHIDGRTKQVTLELASEESSSLGSSLSSMFGTSQEDDYNWKVFLSDLKPLALDLNYAIGDSYIDLSDLPIKKLKMRSGSANVKVNYNHGMGNKMEMDTFLIQVDMGTFEAKNLHLCNSAQIITDIGFGKVQMDFEGADKLKTNVKATVGAGKLEVLLPSSHIPVKININESPLCHIKIPEEFERIGDDVFVSQGYDENVKDQINFNVDVAVGNIVFRSNDN